MKTQTRIEGYDLARALAIWGMVTVHFWIVLAYRQAEPAWLKWCLDMLDGRAAALFVILAGVGISLLTKSARAKRLPAADNDAGAPVQDESAAIEPLRGVLFRRGLFLLVAGFLNLVIWRGDILRVYGVSLCLAAVLIDVSDRRLLATAAFFVIGFIGLFLVSDYGQEWNWDTFEYANLWTAHGTIRNLFYNGFRSVFPWTGLLVFGMWLGRRDLSEWHLRRRVLLISASLAVAVELFSALAVRLLRADSISMKEDEAVWLFGTASMPPLPLFLIAASATAVAVICLSLMIAQRFAGAIVVRSLVACGQMAFTWYVLHIVVGLGGLLTLGLEGAGSLVSSVLAAAGFFAVISLISLAIRSSGRRGPLESLMRRIAG